MECGRFLSSLQQELPLFSDYGFDPQIDYFQELFREAKRKPSKRDPTKPPEPLRFRLQKPISKDHHARSKSKRSRWWSRALPFWRRSTRASKVDDDHAGCHSSGACTAPMLGSSTMAAAVALHAPYLCAV